ncbi:hypothetical protein D1Q00_gp153 [Trichoplusia ni granulovirus LBIV-12]|uniref:Uncharacterized protein n=2 Tax=Betabaculovirus TaxID=558017 RepID=A0A1D8QLG0_GVTN|nr:hypothetical protein D1Q00_gp153 [Trichoplusia ni granulovirus LBIV-12]AOW41491.1 hypothetical protein [Trichoplusia ni granulovirus LBIV-12]
MFALTIIFVAAILQIEAQNYLSTYQALLDGRSGYCLGDCVNSQCVIKFNSALAKCTYSNSSSTPQYRTIHNHYCYSNCGYFDGQEYQWCVTSEEDNSFSWDYCSRKVANKAVETVQTDNEYMTCGYTTCSKHNKYSYNWCGTIGTYWEYCNPSNKVLLIDYITSIQTECASPCEKRSSDDAAYCYDVNYSWHMCYLNPNFDYELDNLHQGLAQFYNTGGTFTRNGYKLCSNLKIVTIKEDTRLKPRFKIYPIDYGRFTRQALFKQTPHGGGVTLHNSFDVEHVAQFYADHNPTVTVQDINLDTFNVSHHTLTNPIVSYTVLPIPNYMYAEQVNLPLVVNAIITTSTLPKNKMVDRPFDSSLVRHLQHMHNNHTTDEGDFIISYALGGPVEKYNVIPQAWKHKNKRLSLTNTIENFLSHSGLNLHVRITAVVVYKMDRHQLVHRPTAVMMRVRLMDEGRLVNVFGERIRPSENSMENMYFSNDPELVCGYNFTSKDVY